MAKTEHTGARAYTVRPEDYASVQFARLEKERMWPKSWVAVCREQEVPKVGDTFVYDLCDESIFVVRSAENTIRAFYNACPHRGRMLVTGERKRAGRLFCPFHGWTFDLEGNCTHVHYAEDWEDEFNEIDTSLSSVRCETWGGWVFINQDRDACGLRDYLGAAFEALDPFEFERQQIAWNCTVVVNANWKIVLEAFAEAYHIRATHPQQSVVLDHERIASYAAGLHGSLGTPPGEAMLPETKPVPQRSDLRPVILEFIRQLAVDVSSMYTARDMAAASRIMTELPPSATAIEIYTAIERFRMEAAIASGVGWPETGKRQMLATGTVWHLFPNTIVLTGPTASMWYRAQPLGNGEDPGQCKLEFMALERHVEGYAPLLNKRHFEDWRDMEGFLPPFLWQDFGNLPFMQKGVQSRGFRGALLNPVQEQIIANHHKQLRAILGLDE